MLNLDNVLIVLANVLLFMAIASRCTLCEYLAWILWIAGLLLDIKKGNRNKGTLLIHGSFIILLIIYLIFRL